MFARNIDDAATLEVLKETDANNPLFFFKIAIKKSIILF